MNQDQEHLRLLVVFHYVVAGLGALFSCFPLIHLVIGILMVSGRFDSGSKPPPPEVGWVFIGIALVIIFGGRAVSAGLAYAGRCLARREKHTFCLVIAGITCLLCSPFGTVLGVFTIIVLLRPTVKVLFGQPAVSARL